MRKNNISKEAIINLAEKADIKIEFAYAWVRLIVDGEKKNLKRKQAYSFLYKIVKNKNPI